MKKKGPSYYLYDNGSKDFIPLGHGLVCGRSEGDRQFPKDELMSRKHCRFLVLNGVVTVEDLGSSNQTLVNSRPLLAGKKYKLFLNDLIVFGKQRWTLTNQVLYAPGNVDDRTTHTNARRVAAVRDDGSLTTQISGFILKQTRILMSPKAYRQLQVREFTRLRGWDFSTLMLVFSQSIFWAGGGYYLYTLGAFGTDLLNSAANLALKYLVVALTSTLGLGLLHYLLVRKRQKNPVSRVLVIPAWWLLGLCLLLPVELLTSIGTQMAENITQHTCLRKDQPQLCKPLAKENWIGFHKLPNHLKQAILDKMTLGPSSNSSSHP